MLCFYPKKLGQYNDVFTWVTISHAYHFLHDFIEIILRYHFTTLYILI
jgi:hypothetical protein